MTREETLDKYARDMARLFEKLDESLASEETIAYDTKNVGNFLSTLHIAQTEEDIINRAIRAIEFVKELSDSDCYYRDNCPSFSGSRHGTCLSCQAKEALGWTP